MTAAELVGEHSRPSEPAPGGGRGRPARSTRGRVGRALLGAVLVVALAALVVTAVRAAQPAAPPPARAGLVGACDQLSADLAAAGSMAALLDLDARSWSAVADRYRARLGAAFDRGVGGLLASSTLGVLSERRTAVLAAIEWCLTVGWVPRAT